MTAPAPTQRFAAACRPRLALLLLALAAAPSAQAQGSGDLEVGVDADDALGVEYRLGNEANEQTAELLTRRVGPSLRGSPRAWRTRFRYRDPELGEPIAVHGVIYQWLNFRLERYRVADLSEAVLLADHRREDPSQRCLVLVDDNEVLVMSGPALDEPLVVQRVREVAVDAWEPDALAVRGGGADFAYHTPQAAQAHPAVGERRATRVEAAYARADASALQQVTTQGDAQRTVAPDGQVGVVYDGVAHGTFADARAEAAALSLVRRAQPTWGERWRALQVAEGRGLAGALGSTPAGEGSPRPPRSRADRLPETLTPAQAGRAFSAAYGDEVHIEIPGREPRSPVDEWQVTYSRDVLELEDDGWYRPDPKKPDGLHFVTFLIEEEGTTTIVLSRGGETLEFTVVVR
jgi:hypothetical protein